MTKTIHDKFKENFYKSSDFEELYQNYPNPWGLTRDIAPIESCARYDNMIAHILKYCQDEINTGKIPWHFAELGCGEGFFADYFHRKFPTHFIHGFDISSTAIERATKIFGRPDIYFYQADLALPTQFMGLYNCVIYADFLYYIESREGKINAANFATTQLPPGGFVLVVDRSRRMINTSRLFCPLGFDCLEESYVNEGKGCGYRIACFRKKQVPTLGDK